MQISVRCQSCKNEFEVESYYRGLIVSCPECNGLVKVDEGNYQSPTSRRTTSRQVDATSASGSPVDSWSDDKSKAANTDRESQDWKHEDDTDRSWDANSQPQQPTNLDNGYGTSKYHVRTPDGSIYGTVDAATVLRWGEEGRLTNDTSVRQDGSDAWTHFPDWKTQIESDTRGGGNDQPGTARETRVWPPNGASPNRTPTEHDFRPRELDTVEQAHKVEIGHNETMRFGGKSLNGRVILIVSILSWFFCFLFPFSLFVNLFLIGYAWHKLSIRLGDSNLADNEAEFTKERIFIVVGLTVVGILTCFQMLFIAAWMVS